MVESLECGGLIDLGCGLCNYVVLGRGLCCIITVRTKCFAWCRLFLFLKLFTGFISTLEYISLRKVYNTSALHLLAIRELLFTLYLDSGLRPTVWKKGTFDN